MPLSMALAAGGRVVLDVPPTPANVRVAPRRELARLHKELKKAERTCATQLHGSASGPGRRKDPADPTAVTWVRGLKKKIRLATEALHQVENYPLGDRCLRHPSSVGVVMQVKHDMALVRSANGDMKWYAEGQLKAFTGSAMAVSALMIAAYSGDLDAVLACLQSGTDPAVTDPTQENASALHWAAATDRLAVAMAVIDSMPDGEDRVGLVNVANDRGQTPLFFVRSSQMIDLLLTAGCKADAVDKDNKTATDKLREQALQSTLKQRARRADSSSLRRQSGKSQSSTLRESSDGMWWARPTEDGGSGGGGQRVAGSSSHLRAAAGRTQGAASRSKRNPPRRPGGTSMVRDSAGVGIGMAVEVASTSSVWCADGSVQLELDDSLASCIETRWAVVDKQRRDGRRLTVHKHLVHSMEDAMYQVECGANGDAEDLVECRRLMNDAAKKVRQIAAAKAIAKKEGGEQPPDRVVNPELQLDWPPNEELEPLFNHIANIDEGLEQVLFCLACDPPKTEEAEEEAFLAAEEFLSKDPKWPVAPSWMIEEEEEPTADDDEEAPPDPLDALPPGPRPQPPIRVEVKRGLPPERHYGQGEGFTLRDVLDCKKMSKALARLEQRQLQVREGEWEEVVEGGRRRVGWGEWIWPDLKPLHDMAEEQKPRFHRQMYRWQAINYASDAIAAVKAAEQTTKESNKVSKAADYAREAGRFAELRVHYCAMNEGELRAELQANYGDAVEPGKKLDLVPRCIDGALFGPKPICPQCGNAKLHVMYKQSFGHAGQGLFTCPGWDEDDPEEPTHKIHKPCNFRADGDELTASSQDDDKPPVVRTPDEWKPDMTKWTLEDEPPDAINEERGDVVIHSHASGDVAAWSTVISGGQLGAGLRNSSSYDSKKGAMVKPRPLGAGAPPPTLEQEKDLEHRQHQLYKHLVADVKGIKAGSKDGMRLQQKAVQKELERRGLPQEEEDGSAPKGRFEKSKVPKLKKVPVDGVENVLNHLLAEENRAARVANKKLAASVAKPNRKEQDLRKSQVLEEMALQHSYGYVYHAERTLQEEQVAEMKLKDVESELKRRFAKGGVVELIVVAEEGEGGSARRHELEVMPIATLETLAHEKGVGEKQMAKAMAVPTPSGTPDELRGTLLFELHKEMVKPLVPITLRTAAREFFKEKDAERSILARKAEVAKVIAQKATDTVAELKRKFAEEIEKMKAIPATAVDVEDAA